MKRRFAFIVALAAVLTCAASAARAEEAKTEIKSEIKTDDFAKRMFAGEPSAKKKSYACFVRRYDAVHLAQHRAQKVGAMTLLVTAEVGKEDKELSYSFAIGVKFRNSHAKFSAGGGCGHARIAEDENGKPYLGCGVECDGGGITIELNADSNSTLVKIDRIALIRDNNLDDDRRELESGKDDKVFKLIRVPLEQCKALVDDKDERLAMLRK